MLNFVLLCSGNQKNSGIIFDFFARYYNCVHGFPHAYECPPPLVFDEAQGTCVREEQASSFAKKCEKSDVKEEIEGMKFVK